MFTNQAPQVIEKFGGASRDRTDDLIVANDALSQLSYSPTFRRNRMISAAILSAFPPLTNISTSLDVT